MEIFHPPCRKLLQTSLNPFPVGYWVLVNRQKCVVGISPLEEVCACLGTALSKDLLVKLGILPPTLQPAGRCKGSQG